MKNSLPTWLRAFRVAVFAGIIFQLIYSFLPMTPGFEFPLIAAVCMALINLAPWLLTSRAWVWWPSYALLVWITYRVSENVANGWSNYLTGNGGSFLAWSIEIKFMMIYGTIEVLFLVAQIIVLPFYRNLFVQPMRPDDPVPA